MLDDSADGPMHTRRPGWRQSGIYQPVSACSLHVHCGYASSVAGHLSLCGVHLLMSVVLAKDCVASLCRHTCIAAGSMTALLTSAHT